MSQRLIVFNADDLRQLIVHYTDGALLPIDSEVIDVGVSKFLQRMISLNIASAKWGDENVNPISGELQPYEFSYEGKRTMSWTDKHDEVKWAEQNETPTRQ